MLPSASFRSLHGRLFRFALGLIAVGFVLIVVLYCGLRLNTAYATRRAIRMLGEAASLQIGAPESSILPLVSRYGAVKWNPYSPIPISDCADKAECEFQNANLPDYAYEIDFSPFNLVDLASDQKTGLLHHALAAMMYRTSSSWRDPVSLRDWIVYAQVNIRAGHVKSVDSGLFVEGRTGWLGDTWYLLAEKSDFFNQSKAYSVEGSALTFPGPSVGGVIHNLTSDSTAEQLQIAHSFNAGCLTGLVPCSRLCDLMPRVFQYITQHPEVSHIDSSHSCSP